MNRKRITDLTVEQEKALRVLAKMPGCSIEEWSDRMGLTYGTMAYHRRNLTRKGFIVASPGKARTTRLTKKAQESLGMEAN